VRLSEPGVGEVSEGRGFVRRIVYIVKHVVEGGIILNGS